MGYTPWCPRSAELMPQSAEAANLLIELGLPVVMAKLDAERYPKMASYLNIKGYPTLLLFTNGTSQPYTGGFTAEEIVIWARKKTVEAGEPVVRLISIIAFAGMFVVGLFDEFKMQRDLDEEEHSNNASSNGLFLCGQTRSLVIERSHNEDIDEDAKEAKVQSSRYHRSLPRQKMDVSLDRDQSKMGCGGADRDTFQRDMDMMKEKFAKLLLGEDMSGGGKGVSSALALSNAITNLAASVFGEQRKLEPMSADNRARWKKEIDWLLSVTDHIVEFAPSQQKGANGVCMEIMTTKQRTDLQMNIPALRKLDAMLLDCLDNFKDQNEFYYVSKDADESEQGAKRDDKWWLPTVKVPPNGLSEVTKKWLLFQKDSVNQVLKAAMAINAQVLHEMEIPEDYIESLPKNGRASLGDAIYKNITDDSFDPDQFLSTMDLSSEHKIVDLKNRIEASVVIWKRKMTNKDSKGPWGSAVSLEKRELFEDRAETILQIIKQRYPGISQSSLDISKIQFNRDVGHAILESYSRILESLAHTVLSRIDDVLYADALAQNPSLTACKRNALPDLDTSTKFLNAEEEIEKLNTRGTPTSMTLLDFIGWSADQGNAKLETPRETPREENEEVQKEEPPKDNCDDSFRLGLGKLHIPYLMIPRKLSMS